MAIVCRGQSKLFFVVKDNGIGMSEEFQKKLFEPFSREDNSMTNATQELDWDFLLPSLSLRRWVEVLR